MPPEVQAFLVELARAVQRLGIYPSGHPVVRDAAATTVERLETCLSGRKNLTIHIEPNHLEVDEVATDPEHILFRGLASRCYRHLLFGLTFHLGVSPDELSELLSALTVVPGPTAHALGDSRNDQLERWPHIRVERIAFESLALAQEIQEEPEDSWTGEAAAHEALQQLEKRVSEVELPRLTELLQRGGSADSTDLFEGISRLVVGMEPGTLRQLVNSLPESYRQSATEGAVEEAILKIIEAGENGQKSGASEALMQLLVKLAVLTDPDEKVVDDPGSDEELAAILQRMGMGWDIDNPTPDDYEQTLHAAHELAGDMAIEFDWSEDPDPERIVQISLELDEVAPPTLKATASLIENGSAGGLMGLLDDAPEAPASIEALWRRVDRKETVGHLLRHRPVDYPSLDRMIGRIWVDSAGPMLDSLLESESRLERLTLLERLGQIGPEIGPLVMERLETTRWYQLRNLLSLLGCCGELPTDFSPEPYLTHTDSRVRREGFFVALKHGRNRRPIILRALDDPDPLVMEQGLTAAAQRCPPEAVPILIAMLKDEHLSVRLRILTIRALTATRTSEVLEALCSLIWVRKFLFWYDLAPKSAVMLESLAAITRVWRDHPRARPVLERAQVSPDPQIRAVVRSAARSA